MAQRRLAGALSCLLLVLWVAGAAGQLRPQVAETTEELVDDLLRSAVQSELAGDANTHALQLDQALLVGPDVPVVNHLAGRVASEGSWLTVQEYQEDSQNDPRFLEYSKLRDALDGTPYRERDLARWCGKNGWFDAERFHYARLLAYPEIPAGARTEALRKLNLKEVGSSRRRSWSSTTPR
jgi:hypothetical protein